MNNTQLKTKERFAGIPSDEWLNSLMVDRSKRKHLELLGLLREGSTKAFVLDAGCGPGTYGMILAENKEFNVIGLDISKVAIKKAQERSSKRRLNFNAVEGDLESLPFESTTFDIIFSGWTLHHFPSLETVCSEFFRVLKQGGKLAIVEPNEINPMMRFSRFIEDGANHVVLRIGWDTPNRTIHTNNEYITELQKQGFTNFEFSSCYTYLPPILNSNNFLLNIPLKIIYFNRAFLFGAGTAILPHPMNGPELIITAIKK